MSKAFFFFLGGGGGGGGGGEMKNFKMLTAEFFTQHATFMCKASPAFTSLWAYLIDDKLVTVIILVFPRKQDLTFHANEK